MESLFKKLTTEEAMEDFDYRFIDDPGHGWMEVPVSHLYELGIQNDISVYSYLNKHLAYLEEDCDAGEFFSAYRQRFGKLPKTHSEYQEDTFVRNLPHYE